MKTYRVAVAILVLVGVLAVAGCGGGGSSSDSSSSTTTAGSKGDESGGAGSAEAVAAAKKVVAQHASPPTTIVSPVPIKKAIPTGKKLVYVNCENEACVAQGKALEEAAAALGWSVTTINAEPTPQAIQAAFTQAVRERPDAVVGNGFSSETFNRELKELNADEIPVFMIAGTDESNPGGPGISACVLCKEALSTQAAALGDKMIVDAGGKGEIGMVRLTEFPIVKAYADAFAEEIGTACPECKLNELEVSPTSIGKDAPSLIASWLRTNPDLHYIYLTYDELGSGVEAALKTTGVEYPNFYGQAPSPQGIAALEDGKRVADVPGAGLPEASWQVADIYARMLTGEPIEPSMLEWPVFAYWGKEYTIPSAEGNQIDDYQTQYEKLWGK